jgi:hypothetical protein
VLADLEFGSQEEAGPLSFLFFFFFSCCFFVLFFWFDLIRFHHDHHAIHFSMF